VAQEAEVAALAERTLGGTYMKRQRIIVYWEFTIDILGPGHKSIAKRRKMRKVLSRKRLKVIEQAALLATKAKLPAGFTATLS
jgi:hypothetical protein